MTTAIHCCIKYDAEGQEHYLFNACANNLEQLLARSVKGVFPLDQRLYKCKQFPFRNHLVVNVWYFQPLNYEQLYIAYMDTLNLLLVTVEAVDVPLAESVQWCLERFNVPPFRRR